MKIKIDLGEGETVEQANEILSKTLKAKSDFHDHERYSDDILNELHDHVLDLHKNLLSSLIEDLKQEISIHANK